MILSVIENILLWKSSAGGETSESRYIIANSIFEMIEFLTA